MFIVEFGKFENWFKSRMQTVIGDSQVETELYTRETYLWL